MSEMKVVLDTNVPLVSLPKISKYRPIFEALLKQKFTLAITEDILQEYMEIIGQKTTHEIAQNVGELLTQLKNVERTEVYFKWNLITQDPDDNKFVDCAISANVRFIVSNDKHFQVLKEVDFPPVDVILADDFLAEIESL